MNKSEIMADILAKTDIMSAAPVSAWTKMWDDTNIPPNLAFLNVTDWQYRKQYMNSADYICHAITKSTDGRIKKVSIFVSVADEGLATETASYIENDPTQLETPVPKPDTTYADAVKAYVATLAPPNLLLIKIDSIDSVNQYAVLSALIDNAGTGVWKTYTVYGPIGSFNYIPM